MGVCRPLPLSLFPSPPVSPPPSPALAQPPLAVALPLQATGPPAVPPRAGPAPPPAEWVQGGEGLRRVLAQTEAAPAVGLDTETTGLDPYLHRVRTLQLALPDRVWVVDAFSSDLAPLRPWLAARAAAGRRTLLHNAKFDLKMLRAATGGAPLRPVAVSDLWLWSLVLGCGLPPRAGEAPPGHGLAALAARHLGLALPKGERSADWSGALRPEQVAYAGRDAWVLLPLARILERGLAAAGLLRVAAVEDACVPAVADMEYAGIGFDLAYWRELTAGLRAGTRQAAGRALALLQGAAGRPAALSLDGGVPHPALNLNSPAQLRAALASAGLTLTGTSERVLRRAADRPAVAALLAYRRQAKLLQAAEALPRFVHPRTGRIHAAYHQLNQGAGGRLSCAGPNVQQIPQAPAFRRAFVAGPGRLLVVADLSQIELRIMCRLSGDQRMLAAYRRGLDLHRLTASLLTGVPVAEVSREQRQLAKAANFGLIYAMSAAGLRAYAADAYGVELSTAEAETFRQRFFAAYPGIGAFHRRQDTEARRAREVRTLLGRCRRWEGGAIGLPELVNTPAQGSGADILKRAMGLLRPALVAAEAELVASVHDELVVEGPAARAGELEAAVRAALIGAAGELLHPVPAEVEVAVGGSWAAKG